jgi:hypothetical protein
MVTTRRSSLGKQPAPPDPFEDRKRQRVLGDQASGIRRLGKGTVECFSKLELLFAHSQTGLWFRVLPIDGHDDDICVGLGVEWKYLLPLLTKCGLVRSKVTSVVKDVHVDHGQWDELAKAITRAVRMEITAIRTKYSRKSYFICIGQPKFQNPLEQDKALKSISKKKREELFSALQPPPRQLVLDVQEVATAIVDERLARRVLQGKNPTIRQGQQQEGQQQEADGQQQQVAVVAQVPTNDNEMQVVTTAVHNLIEFAAALDLERRPRLSRTTAGTSSNTTIPFKKILCLFSNIFVLFVSKITLSFINESRRTSASNFRRS